MKRGHLVLGVSIGVFLVALTALPAVIRLTVDWYWFSAIEFQTVFLTALWTKTMLGVGVGLLAFGFFYANLRFAQRGMVPDPLVVNINAKVPTLDVTRLLRLVALPVSAFLAVLFGSATRRCRR